MPALITLCLCVLTHNPADFGPAAIVRRWLQVEGKPITVQGRLLPAPVIQYGHPKNYYAGTTGAWNMVDVRLLFPRTCWR